ncbi:Alpha-D-kanosaminyltransferase [Anatilimnocola aggregata]|uniref:Alpha-D-kanosaminyltransferase n=1 Tax=Anatilimnocola aggregata TaxID=2528021 RepID=A0A517YLX2_9BACT|nr:glycosyltransferase family 4 protein [Anatilimnocola aggregata]QDU31214.1 Alpha-D-kanosaminyltransferase [Anatilimnocola aggregata]
MSGTLQNPVGQRLSRQTGDSLPAAPRIAIVARRFWPIAGEAELDLVRLAEELSQLGAAPTIITPRWEKQWSERSRVRGVPVVRLPWPATPGWGMLRYLYSLSRYLRQQRQEFDAVLVAGLRAEAFCALASLPENEIPVVLRASEAGTYGEVAWQQQARFGSRIANSCRQAGAIIANSSFVAAELRAANYPAERIHVLPSTTDQELPTRTPATKAAARVALAAANHDLHIVGEAPVAVCIASLQPERGLEAMIRAWLPIQHRWPHARLWIVGDGPARETMFRLVCDLDVRYRVVLPGTFDDWTDLLQAADVLIAPAPRPSQTTVLRAALASGLAVVATDQTEHRQWIEPEQNGLLYAASEKNSLTLCLTRLFENAALRERLGQVAKQSALSTAATISSEKESRWLLNLVAAHRDHS